MHIFNALRPGQEGHDRRAPFRIEASLCAELLGLQDMPLFHRVFMKH